MEVIKIMKELRKTIDRNVTVKSLSRVRLFAIPWTVVYQASLPTGLSRQEYWSGLLFPSPGDLPDPGIKSRSPALQADALPSETLGEPQKNVDYCKKELEIIKRNQLNWKTHLPRQKSELKAINTKLEDRIMKITQSEQQSERLKK